MNTFSIVIPTYNRATLLARTLESVLKQAFLDYEIIVVDDGSNDGTMESLQKYVTARRLKLLMQSNKGAGAARNLGAAKAKGDYLAFLDSDDLWFPWTLASFVELIRKYDRPAVLASRLMNFVNEKELEFAHQKPAEAKAFSDYLSSSRAGYFVGAGMSVLRREEFLKSGGFTEKRINAEDHDLILRMGEARGFVQVLEPVTLGLRNHSDSASTNVRKSYEGNLYLINQEHSGSYPGGKRRSRARCEIITRHVRPVTLECLRQRMHREAWQLYRSTFVWHVQQGRWKYLAGFPLRALFTSK